jgi:hypothetical protein
MDPRPTARAVAALPAEAPSPSVAVASPDDALRAEVLRRFARIVTIIGILAFILYLITRNWD